MIEHCGCPREPGNEVETQVRIGGNGNVVECKRKRSHSPPVHLLVRAIAGMQTHCMGVTAHRCRVRVGSSELLCPIGSESLRVLRVNPALERMSQDRVGQAAVMPSVRQRTQHVATAERLKDGAVHRPKW